MEEHLGSIAPLRPPKYLTLIRMAKDKNDLVVFKG
jgi:hypothetical protein